MFTVRPTTEEPIATFDVPCGRRGCAHVFHYAGHDAFKDVSAMLKDHLPNCPGRSSPATPIEWPTPTIFRRICDIAPNDAQADCYSYGSFIPNVDTPHPPSKFQAKPLGTTHAPDKGLKTGRKWRVNQTSERCVALDTDPSTQASNPQDVMCRGCTPFARLTKLDWEYAPARWIKHQNRCKEIKKQRAVERVKARRLKVAMQSSGPEPIYQPTTFRSRHISRK
ncbi:hypothetical protein C8R46DRAFT_1191872 [Mycena filopes]|nr:hypothetical protein C8R46DRAFT_1191872 [Mycena filopes]